MSWRGARSGGVSRESRGGRGSRAAAAAPPPGAWAGGAAERRRSRLCAPAALVSDPSPGGSGSGAVWRCLSCIVPCCLLAGPRGHGSFSVRGCESAAAPRTEALCSPLLSGPHLRRGGGLPPPPQPSQASHTHRPLPPHPPVTYRPLTGSTERGCPASQTRSLVPRGSSKFSSHQQHLLAEGLGVLSLPVPALCLSHRASAQCGRIPAFSPRCGTVGFSPE